jgi:hypothetical protein
VAIRLARFPVVIAGGEVTVLVPPTPEEVVEAEAALLRVIEALAEMAAREDYAAARARQLEGRAGDEQKGAIDHATTEEADPHA